MLTIEQIISELADNVKDVETTDNVKFDTKTKENVVLATHLMCSVLPMSDGIQLGIFANEDGSIEVIAQSTDTDRRLTCRFESEEFYVARIDRGLNRIQTSAMNIQDIAEIKKLAEWIIDPE